jgi:hypothetical protein
MNDKERDGKKDRNVHTSSLPLSLSLIHTESADDREKDRERDIVRDWKIFVV